MRDYKEILDEVKEAKKSAKIKKFDDVHDKTQNITGMVYDIKDDNVVIRTPKGNVNAKMKNLKKMPSV